MPQMANGTWCTQADFEFFKATEVFAWNDGPMYDTYRFTPSSSGAIVAGQRRLFSVVLGQNGDGFTSASDPKTYAETNHTESGKMSGDRAARITAIGAVITSPLATISAIDNWNHDVQQLLRNIVLAFNSADTTRYYGRLSEFPGGGGMAGYAAIGNTDGSPPVQREVIYASNGLPSFGSMVRLCEDVKIAPQQSFTWILQSDRVITLLNGVTTSYDVMVKCWGMIGVRVQG